MGRVRMRSPIETELVRTVVRYFCSLPPQREDESLRGTPSSTRNRAALTKTLLIFIVRGRVSKDPSVHELSNTPAGVNTR